MGGDFRVDTGARGIFSPGPDREPVPCFCSQRFGLRARCAGPLKTWCGNRDNPCGRRCRHHNALSGCSASGTRLGRDAPRQARTEARVAILNLAVRVTAIFVV